MGQTFKLVAPRAKMTLGWEGKLGEMLFDGSARVLVRLLAVPMRPQNPPEIASSIPTQTRNGRCTTQMAAHDSAKDIRTEERAKRKADDEMITGSSQRRKQAKTKDDDNRAGTDHSVIDHSITFSKLSPELHRLIFTFIERIEDIICLGLANRYFWAIGRGRMHDYYASFLGRWAHENIVCVGEDVKPDDYPPGLFSAEELDVLRQKTRDILYDWDYDDDDDMAETNVPFTLHHFTFPSVSTEEEVFLRGHSLALVGRFSSLRISEDPAFTCICSEILVREETYFPPDQQWILRNLTMKQFVRSEAIALKPEFLHGPSISVLGFGELVMSRICWSTSSSVRHCFDITMLARHRDEIHEVGWSDLSDEVAREIAGIWESEYGPDWRETVSKDAFSLSVFGKSTVPFSTFDLVEFGGVRRESWFSVLTPPPPGSSALAHAVMEGEYTSAEFEFRARSGELFSKVAMTPGPGGDDFSIHHPNLVLPCLCCRIDSTFFQA
ncbi:F-box domain containing protein [Madurella fahalii]|uniref:F-box domain containing protein n=1 Tax=Madurella fahalii TaxID=1157608 RepID=A0ABQ0G1L3_9PEZI